MNNSNKQSQIYVSLFLIKSFLCVIRIHVSDNNLVLAPFTYKLFGRAGSMRVWDRPRCHRIILLFDKCGWARLIYTFHLWWKISIVFGADTFEWLFSSLFHSMTTLVFRSCSFVFSYISHFGELTMTRKLDLIIAHERS